MARDFVRASSHYIQVTGLLGTPSAVSFSAWVDLDSADTEGAVVISAGDYTGLLARVNWDGSGQIGGWYYSGGNWYERRGASIQGAGWTHVGYGFQNGAQRLYRAGTLVSSSSEGRNITWSGLGANTQIARHGDGSTDWDFDGRLAEIGAWNVRLTDDEFAALAKGVSPRFIRPSNLILYHTLDGRESPEPDFSGNAYNGTVSGATYANHAPVEPLAIWIPSTWEIAAGGPTTVEATATDGFSLGESIARQAVLYAGIVDGLNVGEAQTGRASLFSTISDGATFSDASSVTAAFVTALGDGLTLGETLTRIATYPTTATDGVTFSESATARAALLASAADGLTLGESLAVSAVLAALVADGVTFAEVLSGEFAGALSGVITDGIALGDVPSALAQLIAAASDGTAFGDTVLAALSALATATDGLTFGDTAAGSIAASVITALITDGLAFGDAGAIQAALTVSVSDGVQFAETLQVVSALLATVTDGFKVGEVTFTVEAAGLVTVTFTHRQGSISFTVRQPAATFTSRKPGVSFTGDP